MLGHPVDYMGCALSLAELALGYTSPNPAVGVVVVKHGAVVGLGHTQPPGSAHAEVVALQQAGERARGATIYVTLEPCCHYGRTPPCTQAIIDAVEELLGDQVVANEVVTDLQKCVDSVVPLRSSKKHMSYRTMGRLEPTSSLKYQAAE